VQPQQQQSLYRRHRPRNFAAVVGQEPVVRTLRHAVERGKVHHAYLFVGSRGTGKTSMAKILAACLNCENGPTVEPCGRCESCISIGSATSLDVIEMDAASNNSVDDIRELRESVAYAPVSGRRKVYILDEAHMLSTAAWNAFLKTLEEPPPDTVFVLATTEAGKVPATVVDRCHRFDFHRPTVEQISEVLRRAAAAESIEIPPAALAAIARAATGSFRDALGTLEQLVTYSGGEIALEDVLAVLGVADWRLLEQAVEAVAAADAARALELLAESVDQGRDAASFASDLEVRVRELLVVQTLGRVPAELSLTPEADEALARQAQSTAAAAVVRLLELLGEAMEAVRAGADARTRLELALVKAARPEVDGSTRALLARIERLEAGQRPVTAVAADRDVQVPPSASPPARPDAAAGAGAPSASAGATIPSPATPAAATAAGAGAAATAPAAAGAAPNAEAPTDRRSVSAEGGAAVTHTAPASGGSADAQDVTAGSAQAAPQRTAVAEPPAAVGTDVDSIAAVWTAIVDLVRSENARLAAALERSRPVAADGGELTVGFGSSFFKKQAERPADRMTLGEAVKAVTGTPWRIGYELREGLGEEVIEETDDGRSEERWMARFMNEFDAEEVPGEWSEAAAESVEKGA
jgi:DNA polymerase-3 subunit gamma/tau